MESAICTLFEGHYHYGVATLSNSLYHCGFRGTIYVGYRGDLPKWALKGKKIPVGKWQEAYILNLVDGLSLTFLKLNTNYSLTNYKPDFMIELWEEAAQDVEALYYFDPDIVINESWKSFQNWITCGVAVCEDVNSPMSEFHPRRVGWRNYFKSYNIDLKFKDNIYVNGGFVGVSKKDKSFLFSWKTLQEYMGEAINGLENSIFSNQTEGGIPKMQGFQIFDKSDQDALNAAIEVFDGRISFMGAEAMGFKSGHRVMSHALGSPKPWMNNLLLGAMKGKPPRNVDIAYWKIENNPILVHSKFEIMRKKMSIYVAKFINRFYKA